MSAAPTPADVSGVLLRAVEVLAERGWCQDAYTNDAGQVCVRGAMNVAVIGQADADLLDSALERLDGYLRSQGWGVLAERWNDVEGRTADEVVAALRAAAVGAGCR
jgi:hypothetical protein